MTDYGALKPWLLARTPTGRRWHVVSRYEHVGNAKVLWHSACRSYDEGHLGDPRTVMMSAKDAEGPVCRYCVNRVEQSIDAAIGHRDRLREMNA